eukprot:10005475-Lingulodinium_polyedra.AAC.1
MQAREANQIPWNVGIRDIPGRYSPPGDAHGYATYLWISAGFARSEVPGSNLATRTSTFESGRSLGSHF